MITMRLEGGSEFARLLGDLSTRVSRQVQREILRTAAEPMRERMAELAPHEPGKPDLRDAMTISNAAGQDSQETAIAVGPGRDFYYGSFQEFGTSRFPAQPFARPAFDATVRESLEIIGDEIWFAVRHGIDRF